MKHEHCPSVKLSEMVYCIVPGKPYWPAAPQSDEMQPQLVDFINSGRKQRAAIKITKTTAGLQFFACKLMQCLWSAGVPGLSGQCDSLRHNAIKWVQRAGVAAASGWHCVVTGVGVWDLGTRSPKCNDRRTGGGGGCSVPASSSVRQRTVVRRTGPLRILMRLPHLTGCRGKRKRMLFSCSGCSSCPAPSWLQLN